MPLPLVPCSPSPHVWPLWQKSGECVWAGQDRPHKLALCGDSCPLLATGRFLKLTFSLMETYELQRVRDSSTLLHVSEGLVCNLSEKIHRTPQVIQE